MWELHTRTTPFIEWVAKPWMLRRLIIEGARPPLSLNCPPAFSAMMASCLAYNAAVRPTFERLVHELDVLCDASALVAERASAAGSTHGALIPPGDCTSSGATYTANPLAALLTGGAGGAGGVSLDAYW